MVYLYKTVDLTNIECTPVKHLSRTNDEYMKIIKQRFNLLKTIILQPMINQIDTAEPTLEIKPLPGCFVLLFSSQYLHCNFDLES